MPIHRPKPGEIWEFNYGYVNAKYRVIRVERDDLRNELAVRAMIVSTGRIMDVNLGRSYSYPNWSKVS